MCRPVIAAFRDYQDTEDIMSNARKLKGAKLRVNRDNPVEIVDARKARVEKEREREYREWVRVEKREPF